MLLSLLLLKLLQWFLMLLLFEKMMMSLFMLKLLQQLLMFGST